MSRRKSGRGRGASLKQRSRSVNNCGVLRSENADISSESPDKNSGCRKSEVSPAMSIIRGSVESKGVPSGTSDVQIVNIRLLIFWRYYLIYDEV